MNKYYKFFISYEKKVNSLTLRERVLLFCVVLGITYYLWHGLVLDTMFGSKEKIAENIKLVKQQVVQLAEQINAVAELTRLNPKVELSERINLLKKEKQEYEDSIMVLTKQLIPPQEMAKLLEEILVRDHDLTLVQMENTAEEPIFKQSGSGKGQKEQKEEEQVNQIYRHGLKLEFKGTYFATQHFLQKLEKLPWKLLWYEFHYQVQDYPVASVKVVIYTLSLQKSCLGM